MGDNSLGGIGDAGAAERPGGAVIDHLLRQRACRGYTDEPVADEDLVTILRAATHAPSAENRQPWVFVVVRDAATREAIAALTRQVWEHGARRYAERSLDARFLAAVDEFVERGYGGAPVLVVVAADSQRAGPVPDAVLASSVFPATQNMLVAASALGYGSSMTTLAPQAPDALAAIVRLPAAVRPLAVVPIGRPASPLGRPRRRPVPEVAHLDAYGTPFGVPSGTSTSATSGPAADVEAGPVRSGPAASAGPPPPARPPA